MAQMEDLHKKHRERLRQHFLRGADHMDKHTLLELFLTYAIPRSDTNKTAHRLLDAFGSLEAVFDAPPSELKRIKGVGEASAVLIKLMPVLMRLYLDEKNTPTGLLSSFEQIGEAVRYKFVGRTNEVVYLLCLDNKGKVLFFDIIFVGSIDRALLEIRTIVETVVRVGATNVVIAHNHPSSFAIPSRGDIEATRKVAFALSLINVRLVDHIIVAKDDYVSLAESGVISNLTEMQRDGI